jgi:hypothetical protein
MFDAAPETPAQPMPVAASARERMGPCRRFSEIALRLAERLDRQSETAARYAEMSIMPEDLKGHFVTRVDDMARAFAQVARAASICIALEDRIERGPPLPVSRPFGPELVVPVPRESRLKTRRDAVEMQVRQAIDVSNACNPSAVRVDRLCTDLDRLLDRDVAAVDAFLTRPIEQTITELCHSLGLDPAFAFADPQEADAFIHGEPSPARGRKGPAHRSAEGAPVLAREDGVTDADRPAPPPAPQASPPQPRSFGEPRRTADPPRNRRERRAAAACNTS